MPTETETETSQQLLALPRLCFEHFATTAPVPMKHSADAFHASHALSGELGLRLEEAESYTILSVYDEPDLARDYTSYFQSIGEVAVRPTSAGAGRCNVHSTQPVQQLRLMVQVDISTRYSADLAPVAEAPVQLRLFEALFTYVHELAVGLGPDLNSRLPLFCTVGPHPHVPV